MNFIRKNKDNIRTGIIMKLGIKDYISEWKITLFIIIQVVVALFWINGEVSMLADEYRSLNCVESTKKGVYYYSNVLGVNGSVSDRKTLDKTIDKIKGFKGYESVGFQADAYCQVSGYGKRDGYYIVGGKKLV